MSDPLRAHLRRVRRRRRSAVRWTVLGTMLAGATAVTLPLGGVGWPDVVWVAAASGSIALAWLRWADYRLLHGLPVPQVGQPALRGSPVNWPIPRALAVAQARWRERLSMRGSTAAPLMARLDRASRAMRELAVGLPTTALSCRDESVQAEIALREAALRIAVVERAMHVAPPDLSGELERATVALRSQCEEAVTAYERLVGAAGLCAAQGPGLDNVGLARLVEASDALIGIARATSELARRPVLAT